jgi:hypothetical protein
MLPRSISSSSRSTRVIEELQDNLENIQKELENTKIQVNRKLITTFSSHSLSS